MSEADNAKTSDLTDIQVAALYNILHSNIQVPVKNVKEYGKLQDWVVSLVRERKEITIEDKAKPKKVAK